MTSENDLQYVGRMLEGMKRIRAVQMSDGGNVMAKLLLDVR